MKLHWQVINHDGPNVVIKYKVSEGIDTEEPKEYSVRGTLNPTASEDINRSAIDLIVKTDFLKHRFLGMRGEVEYKEKPKDA